MSKTYKHFNNVERKEIFILQKKGYSIRDIAKAIKKNPSSVSRELRRNRVNNEYVPDKANHKAYVRRKYSKIYSLKIFSNSTLMQYIHTKTK